MYIDASILFICGIFFFWLIYSIFQTFVFKRNYPTDRILHAVLCFAVVYLIFTYALDM